MKTKSVKINCCYPIQLQPGEDKFIRDGITISPFSGTIFLEMRCTDISVTSHYSEEEKVNMIRINGRKVSQTIPLHYNVNSNTIAPIRKEFGIFLYKKIINIKRLLVFCFFIFVFCLPSIALAFKSSFVKLDISINDLVAINLPLFLIIALIFTGKRLLSILKHLLHYSVFIDLPHSAHGIHDIISIVKNKSDNGNDNMCCTFNL